MCSHRINHIPWLPDSEEFSGDALTLADMERQKSVMIKEIENALHMILSHNINTRPEKLNQVSNAILKACNNKYDVNSRSNLANAIYETGDESIIFDVLNAVLKDKNK